MFVGNSLVVRLIDALSQLPAVTRYTATVVPAVSTGCSRPPRRSAGQWQTDAGDCGRSLSFYDINALALLRQVSAPLVLIW